MIIFMAMIDSEQDKQSFEQVYMQNRDFMFNYTYRILGDEASTEDAVHDAFLSLAKNYDRYKHLEAGQMRSLLTITVRNAAFRIYNRRKRENVTEDIYKDSESENEALPDISEDAEKKDIKRILFELVRSLDSKYSDVVVLKYYCDLSVNEIADNLGLTPENVKVRLHRARTLLKTKIEGVGIYEG